MPVPANLTNAATATDNATTSSTQFIAPVYGAIDVSGTIDQVTLQQLTVTMTYDDKYEITLDASGSKALLESFDVSGGGDTFAVGWSATKDKFIEVLAKVINDATGTDVSGSTLNKTLKGGIEANLLATFQSVYTNLLPNALENAWSVSASVDASGGATDMHTKLGAPEREIIAQQIPEENWNLYKDASENGIKALPLKEGDELVFIFNVNAMAISSGETKTAGANADTSASATITDDGKKYGPSVQNITYTYDTRKVAFFVKVTDGASAVGTKLTNIE